MTLITQTDLDRAFIRDLITSGPFIPWNACLSTGDIVQERLHPNELSGWRLLMQHCAKNKLYLTHLWFNINGKILACKANQTGYWAAGSLYLTHALNGQETRQYAKGIGWVEHDQIFIIWVGDLGIWRETRSISGQNNIIWAPRK